MGIGYSANNMGRLWNVAGIKGKYQRADNFLVELIVSFGLIGVLLYALLVWGLIRSLRRAIQKGNAPALHCTVGVLALICVGRAMVDVFDEGLWRYLMALLGMYYGFLHSNEWRTRN